MAKKSKYTVDEYEKAVEIVDYFKQSHGMLERKEGIRYIRCQHLKDKTQTSEHYSLYAGERLRFILCPVCHKIHIGAMLRTLKLMEIDRLDVPEFIVEGVEDGFAEGFWRIDTTEPVTTELLTELPPTGSKWIRILKILQE